jgi:hypothetical protein
MTDRKEMHLRNLHYNDWKRTPEAKLLRPPESYGFLLQYPNNFKRVREQFQISWITHKMTEM